jgi:hypothetical protein
LFTTEQLATLTIRRLIFHDVPNPRTSGGQGPTLSQTETELDARRVNLLKERLVEALGSRSAYDIIFSAQTHSPVPAAVQQLTHRQVESDDFVRATQNIATYLFESHFGMVSPGLLAVMDSALRGRAAIVILKIERQEAIQLELTQRNGRTTFSMEVLDNLVLTRGTRLFKAAAFMRKAGGEFEAVAADSQRVVKTAEDVAKFWLRFLGCEISEQPRVRTTKFFNTVVDFINDVVTEPIRKNEIYEHLVSELQSQRRVVSPRTFMEEYLPAALRRPFQHHFETRGVPMSQFPKDTEEIERKIRRRSFVTEHGVTISAPLDQEERIEIGDERIVVNDPLARVGPRT